MQRRAGSLPKSALIMALGALAPLAARAQAAPPPDETILVRKSVMNTIDMHMEAVEGMLMPEEKFEGAEARDHLDAATLLLQTFPHLFPASTNRWKAGAGRDPTLDTFAAPDVWTTFDDFYARAKAASQTAFAASRAERPDEFRKLVRELRAQCDGCHALFRKPD